MAAFVRLTVFVTFCCPVLSAFQRFGTVPTYQEVNPGGTVLMRCLVEEMKGECRWEKDGVPVGLYPGKYEMVAGRPGDCTLRILAASMEYDNGVWQCQVTASDFTQRDTLISDGAQLVVRGMPTVTKILSASYFFACQEKYACN